MNYPHWDVPLLGGGLIIAIVAVTHVFIAQFAVGGGFFLVLGERWAYRTGDARLLAYIKAHSRFFVLLTVVLGAVTGVGIWWSIALVHPTGTSALLRVFVWGWATEWVFFIVELSAALLYYYTWDRVSRAAHLLIGWVYAFSAWGTAAIINGIVSFMLTPGRWLETQNFWHAWLNPTAVPSLFLRTLVCIALAGLYALVTATWLADGGLRRRVVRWAAGWLWPAFVLLGPGAAWYLSQAPESARAIVFGGAPAVSLMFMVSVAGSAVLFLTVLLGPYRDPASASRPLVLVVLLLGLVVTGGTEWVREAIRKPYVIHGYLYSNHVFVHEADEVADTGYLTRARWVASSHGIPALHPGEDVFRVACASCHTVDGYNGLRPLVRGWNVEFAEFQLSHLDTLKEFMPPFLGTEDERGALADWLVSLNQPREAPVVGGER